MFRFFGYIHNFGLYKILFLKTKWFWGSKSNNIKNPRKLDCSTLNFTSLGVSGWWLTSNVHFLEACKHLRRFDPKSQNMTSLKRRCLKNPSTDFSEILWEDVKLMPDKVLKVWRRHLLSFWAIEKIREVVISPPPPALRWVKVINDGTADVPVNRQTKRSPACAESPFWYGTVLRKDTGRWGQSHEIFRKDAKLF